MKPRTMIVPAARPAPAKSSAAASAPVVLRDGSAVLIRQVRGTDAPLLADGFARLGAASRQMRFPGVKKQLSAAELRYFTDVDHYDHEALGAVDRASGRGVGIARYIRDADDPQAAEIAVTIVDDWQGRGLGAELLAQLSDRARQEGIRRFTALADAGNVAVAALLGKAGAYLVRRGRGTVEYEITLPRGPERKCALSRGQAVSARPRLGPTPRLRGLAGRRRGARSGGRVRASVRCPCLTRLRRAGAVRRPGPRPRRRCRAARRAGSGPGTGRGLCRSCGTRAAPPAAGR